MLISLQGIVNRNFSDSQAALLNPAQGHVGNVDVGLSNSLSQRADCAGLVIILDNQNSKPRRSISAGEPISFIQ